MKYAKPIFWLFPACVLVLHACSASPTPLTTGPAGTPSASAADETSTLTVTARPTQPAGEAAYPAPSLDLPPNSAGAYPAPPGAYPLPGADVPPTTSGLSPGVYPAPGSVASTPGAYPGPGSEPAGSAGGLPTVVPQGGQPYPGPGDAPAIATAASPVGTAQAGGVTPTRPAQTPVPTQSPGAPPPSSAASPTSPTITVTPTATRHVIVRTKLKATDPKTFEPASGQTQLVEFFAFWDPLSKSMAPVVHGLEARYQERMRFTYLDIDDPANSPFERSLGFRYPPHFLLLDGQGEVLKEWVGYVKAEDFEAEFAAQGLTP